MTKMVLYPIEIMESKYCDRHWINDGKAQDYECPNYVNNECRFEFDIIDENKFGILKPKECLDLKDSEDS